MAHERSAQHTLTHTHTHSYTYSRKHTQINGDVELARLHYASNECNMAVRCMRSAVARVSNETHLKRMCDVRMWYVIHEFFILCVWRDAVAFEMKNNFFAWWMRMGNMGKNIDACEMADALSTWKCPPKRAKTFVILHCFYYSVLFTTIPMRLT